MNFLDVACYVSTEYILADYQIINQILLGTRNSYPLSRTSHLGTRNSELQTRNSYLETRTSKLAPRTSKLVPRNLSHHELRNCLTNFIDFFFS
jgi:hypothetical protein